MRRAFRNLVLSLAALCSGLAAGPAIARPYDDLLDAVKTAVYWGDIDELERLYRVALDQPRPAPPSELLIRAFRRGIDDGWDTSSRRAREEMVAMTVRWRAERPQAVLPAVLHAAALYDLAWAVRGSGYSNTVKDDVWPQFNALIAEASAALTIDLVRRADDPLAASYLQRVARAGSVPLDGLWRLANPTLERHPDDWDLYEELAFSAMPKWSGDKDALEMVATVAARRTQHLWGRAFYARVFELGVTEAGDKFFERFTVDWNTLATAFDDQLRVAAGPYWLNRYAYIACIAKDKPRTAQLLARIGTTVDLSAWGRAGGSQSELDRCRAWAAS